MSVLVKVICLMSTFNATVMYCMPKLWSVFPHFLKSKDFQSSFSRYFVKIRCSKALEKCQVSQGIWKGCQIQCGYVARKKLGTSSHLMITVIIPFPGGSFWPVHGIFSYLHRSSLCTDTTTDCAPVANPAASSVYLLFVRLPPLL